MADDADRASALADKELEAILENHKQETKSREQFFNASGRCLNCEEPVGTERRFCDAECAEDYEYRQARKRTRV